MSGIAIPQAATGVPPVDDRDDGTTTDPSPTAPTANSTLVWDAEQCDRRGSILDGGAAVARRVRHAMPRVLNQNRLIETQVAGGGPLVTTLYDVQSRRIAETVETTTTFYIYDGWNCVAEYIGTTLTLAKTRLWGIDLSGSMQGAGGVGGLLAETHHTGTAAAFYPTYDGNGNISEYLDSSGQAIAHFEYDPFGRLLDTMPLASEDLAIKQALSYRFSTKPINSATGLYYYGYRWYDPLAGRWPSRDPIEEEGGVNLYAFVGNEGVNKWDLLGQISWDSLWNYGRCVGDCYSDNDPTGTIIDNVLIDIPWRRANSKDFSCKTLRFNWNEQRGTIGQGFFENS